MSIPLLFDKSFSKSLSKQIIWLVGLMAIVIFVLIVISFFAPYYEAHDGERDGRILDILYMLLDPGSRTDAVQTPLAFLICLVGSVIFSGMLISVLSNILERRVERYINGETDYDLFGHVVVVGYNRSVASLLEKIHEKHRSSQILLMSQQPTAEIRAWLQASVTDDIENALVLINGIRNSKDDIKRLQLNKGVKCIYLLGEENEEAHDASNMACLKYMAEKIEDSKKVDCYLQIESSAMFHILQIADFPEEIKRKLSVYPFSFNDMWAQKLMAIFPSKEYDIPLDGKGITSECTKHVHLIIEGLNNMGSALAINAAQVLHFPNFKEGDFSTCSHITILDDNMENKGQAFRNRLHNLFALAKWREVNSSQCLGEGSWHDPMTDENLDCPYRDISDKKLNFMDIQWEFIKGSIHDREIQEYLLRASSSENEITTLALCYSDSERNAETILSLSKDIISGLSQAFVFQKESGVTIEMLQKIPGYENVKPFGMEENCYQQDLANVEYGKLINAAYKEGPESVDDKWWATSAINQWSSIFSGNMLLYKLRQLGLDTTKPISKEDFEHAWINQKERLAYVEHNRWNTEKLIMGFAPLLPGAERARWKANEIEPNKEEARYNMKKEMKHGWIIPYNKLPKEEQKKDEKVLEVLWKQYKILMNDNL